MSDELNVIQDAMLEGIANRVISMLNTIPSALNDELRDYGGEYVAALDYMAKDPRAGLRLAVTLYSGYIELLFTVANQHVYRLILRRPNGS